MAYPTIPAMEVRDDDLYAVYIVTSGTPGTADGTLMGQLDNIQFGSQADNRHYPRVGTGSSDRAGDTQHQVTMRLYVDSNLNEVCHAMGMGGTAGLGTSMLRLDTTQTSGVRIDAYDLTTASGTVKHQWFMVNFSQRSMQTGVQANNPHLIEVRGIASDIYADPS